MRAALGAGGAAKPERDSNADRNVRISRRERHTELGNDREPPVDHESHAERRDTDAIGLVSHYDSSPDAPGATDDGLGVAVTLEAARVLAARGRRQWTLFALITDGEESGLMGAAGLVTDREVMNRLRAYLNLESIGSAI